VAEYRTPKQASIAAADMRSGERQRYRTGALTPFALRRSIEAERKCSSICVTPAMPRGTPTQHRSLLPPASHTILFAADELPRDVDVDFA